MASFFLRRTDSEAPPDYETPPFPSLYWPIPVRGPQARFLYRPYDIWRFTLVWTLIFFGAVHATASLYAVVVQARNWKIIWIAPIAYVIVGAFEALLAGSAVGGLLAGVYNAGYFSMSTWIPLVWAFINTLVLILSAFAIQGAL